MYKRYYAFISYKREDLKQAEWLRNKLSHYHFPSKLRKENEALPKAIRPLFRDSLELAGGFLAKEIESALSESKYLIVVCSPRSAKSPWVNKEVEYFIEHGREEYIIPYIIDGEPFSKDPSKECFPPALKTLQGEKELLGISTGELSKEAAAVKVVARMFGLRFDTLWQGYEREQRRKRWMWGGIASLVVAVSMMISGWFYNVNNEIVQQKQQKEELWEQLLKQQDVIMSQNDSLEMQNLNYRLAILENEIEKGNNFEPFLMLNSIKIKQAECAKKNNLEQKLNELIGLSFDNIKRYRLDLVDVYIDTTIDNKDDSFYNTKYFSKECVIEGSGDEVYIENIKHNTDTILENVSIWGSKITQDNKYYVFSDGDSILFFYDIQNDSYIKKFESTELYLMYLLGGVEDISNDNRFVLYNNMSRLHSSTFVIDLHERKIIYDDIPKGFPLISPDGRYFMYNKNSNKSSFEITDVKNKNMLCQTNDSIFCNAKWGDDNSIIATKGRLVTRWRLNSKGNLFSCNIEEKSTLCFIAECSSNGKYLAVLTDDYFYVWDVENSKYLCKFKHDVYFPTFVAFSDNCEKIAYVGALGSGGVYDLTKMKHKFVQFGDCYATNGDDFQVKFAFNDEVVLIYNSYRLNHIYSIYSIGADSIIDRYRKIYSIDDERVYFENSMYYFHDCKKVNSEDTLLMYKNNSLVPIAKSDAKIKSNSLPYIEHKPNLVSGGSECIGLLSCILPFEVEEDDGWYRYIMDEEKGEQLDFVEVYLCDSLYKLKADGFQYNFYRVGLLDDEPLVKRIVEELYDH